VSAAELRISGSSAPFSVAVTDGTLPTGWAAVVSDAQVQVSGPGVSAGDYTFTLTVTDSAANAVALPLTVVIE